MLMPLIVALAAVVIILALIPLTKRSTTTKMRTLQATVIDKRRETSVTYVGFFLPTVKHTLITDRRLQAETTRRPTWRSI